MFDIFDISKSTMITSASSTVKKRGILMQILIFCCVMMVASTIVSAITLLPTMLWMLLDGNFKDLLKESLETGVLDMSAILPLCPNG